MNVEDALELAYLIFVVLALIFLFRFRKLPRTYITDYMRGLRFYEGSFDGVIRPGGYKPLTRAVHIEIVDMRPVPFLVESIWYRDALQSESVVSIGAEMLVDDPYLAATSLKDRVGDTLPIVRDTLRTAVSRRIADGNPDFRARLADDIQTTINDELRRVGMKILNVEITEIYSRGTSRSPVAKGLN